MKAEDRTRLMLQALGWQGGTVHQVCEAIGCDVSQFLYADLIEIDAPFKQGWFAIRTSPEYMKTKALLAERGNLQFWFGVIAGQNLIDQGI